MTTAGEVATRSSTAHLGASGTGVSLYGPAGLDHDLQCLSYQAHRPSFFEPCVGFAPWNFESSRRAIKHFNNDRRTIEPSNFILLDYRDIVRISYTQ